MAADRDAAGFSLAEGMVTLALLLLLAGIALAQGPATLASLRVESVTRRVALGIEQGRLAAERSGQPCALQLDHEGWHASAAADLPACPGVELSLGEGLAEGSVQLSSNFPPLVRFSSNG
ncbi:MAG: prepilin-type N-terminal cleavage/methylation domain-containing protein, partial [Cyanobacteriota bacterium]